MSKKKDWKSPTDYLIEAYTNKLINDYKQDDEKEQERQRQRALSSPSTSVPTNSSTSTKNSSQTPQTGSQTTPAERDLFKMAERKFTDRLNRATARDKGTGNTNKTRTLDRTNEKTYSRYDTEGAEKSNIRKNFEKDRAEFRKEHPVGRWLGAEGNNALWGLDAELAKGVDFFLPDVITPKKIQQGLDYYKKQGEEAQKTVEKERGGSVERTILGTVGGESLKNIPSATMAYLSGGASVGAQVAGKAVPSLYKASELTHVGNTFTRALNEVAQTTGKNPMFWETFARTIGTTYENEIENGADPIRATMSAYTNALLNAQIEVGGGIEVYDPSEDFLKAVARSAKEEGLEEVEQYAVENLVNKAVGSNTARWLSLTRGQDAVINPVDMAEQGLYGALSGGLMSGGRTALANARTEAIDSALNPVSAEAVQQGMADQRGLVNRGLVQERADEDGEQISTKAKSLAQDLQAQLDRGEALQPNQVKRLIREINKESNANEQSLERARVREVGKSLSEGSFVEETGLNLEQQISKQKDSALESRSREKAKAILGENASDNEVASVTKVVIGTANSSDIDTVLTKPSLKNAVADMVNEGADADSKIQIPINNVEARTVLENLTAMKSIANRNAILKETQEENSEDIKALLTNLNSGGKDLFANHLAQGTEAIGDVYQNRFYRMYNEGRKDGADFEEAYDRLIAPLGSDVQAVFTRDFAQQIFAQGKASLATDNAKATAKSLAEKYANRKGGLTFENNNENLISSRERDELQKFAERVGVEINVVKSLSKDANGKALMSRTGKKLVVNGKYQNGVITIASDAQNKLITVAKHELTHYIKEMSPERYKELEDFVLKKWYKNDPVAMAKRIEEYQRLYKDATPEEAREELIADASEAFFTDEGAIQDAISFSEKLGRAIHDGIKTMLDAFLGLQDADSRRMRGYGGFLKDLGILQEAERMWLEALEDTQQRKRNARGNATTETTSETEGKLSVTAEEDQAYMDAVNRGDMETAQRMVDEEAKRNGYNIKVFHGTPNETISASRGRIRGDDYKKLATDYADKLFPYVVFRNNGRLTGIYTSTDRGIADAFSYSFSRQGTVYDLYARADKPFTFDAEGNGWNNIPINAVEDLGISKEGRITLEDVSRSAKEQGYDAVVVNNVRETGSGDNESPLTTDVIVFSSTQLKSADPVTYDDNGNVIPLSERFNEGNEDIRWSVSEDSDGNKLSEGQREYFGNSKIVDSKGNLKVMYHGSPNDFDTFDIKRAKAGLYGRGFYFTEDKSRASQYGKTYGVYLDVETPLQTGTHDITKAQLKNFIKVLAEDEDYGIENYGYGATVDSVLKSVWGKDDFAMLQDLNATAVGDFAEAVKLFNKVNGTSYDGIVAPTETIAFYPEQIKETSNKKPTKNPNMKFSVTEPVEETKDLLAVHNLKAEDLRGALDLGGFPMPSIAIIKADAGHNAYGEYSAVFDKSTIDPSVTKKNVVYGGDAWTPTFPQIQYKPNEKVVKRISDIYYDNAKKFGYDVMRPLYGLVAETETALNNEGGEAELKKTAKRNTNLMRAFLTMNGKTVDDVIKRTEETLSDDAIEIREYFINHLGEDVIRDFEGKNLSDSAERLEHRREWSKKHRDEVKEVYADYLRDTFNFDEGEIENVIKNTNTLKLTSFVRDALNYLNNGKTTIKEEVDYQATKEAVKKEAVKNGFNEWVDDLLDGIEEKKGIRNNKEFFTYSGNRRSWETLHDEVSLVNIVKAMASQDNGETLLGSSLKAVAQKQYKNISEIRKDKGRLKTISEDEYKALMDGFAEREKEILLRIAEASPTRETNYFMKFSDIRSAVVDDVRKGLSKEAFLNDLKKWGDTKGATMKDVEDILELVNDVANSPTGYFEAKPKRPVTFYEVKALLAPSDAPTDLISRLQDEGVNVVQYEAGNDEDRIAKLNQASEENNLKFSVSDDEVFDRYIVDRQKRIDDGEQMSFFGSLNETLPSKPKEKTRSEKFYDNVLKTIANIKKKGSWSGFEVKGLFLQYPEFNFIERLNNKADETAVSDFNAFLSSFDKVDDLRNYNWYFSAYEYSSQWKKANRSGKMKFNKLIENRIEEIMAGKAHGRNVGIEKRDYTPTEMRKLFNELNTDKELKELGKKVFDCIDKNFDVKFQGVANIEGFKHGQGGTLGQAGGRTVHLNMKYLNSEGYTDQQKASTILHESIHTVTVYALRNRNNYTMPKNIQDACDVIEDVFWQIKNDPSFKGEYGVSKGAEEMVAELANPTFRAKLKAKNVFARVIEAIRNILGIDVEVGSKANAFKEVNSALETLMSNADVVSFERYANKVSRDYNGKFSVSEEDENAPTPKEYQSTIAKLEEKVADLKSEFKRTDLKTADPKQTRIQAGRLLKRHDSNLTLQNDVVDAFSKIHRLYKEKGIDAFEEASQIALDTAKQVVSGIAIIHDEGAEQQKEIREFLKDNEIIISPYIEKNMDDFTSFRKKNAFRLKLKKGEVSNLDKYIYPRLQELFPTAFPDEYYKANNKEGGENTDVLVDMLRHIGDVLDNPMYEIETIDELTPEWKEYVSDIASDIMETAYGLQTKKTFADKKYEEKVRAVAKAREEALASRDRALAKQAERYETKISYLKQRNKDFKEETRERYEARINDLKEQQKERERKAKERREEAEKKQKEHRKQVHERASARRRTSEERARQERQEQREARREKKQDSEARTRLLNIARRLDRIKGTDEFNRIRDQLIGNLDLEAKSMTGKTKMKLEDLEKWYQDQVENNDWFVKNERLEKKFERLRKTHISDMSLEDVQNLTEILLMLEHKVRNDKKLINSQYKKDVFMASFETAEGIKQSKGLKFKGLHKVDNIFIGQVLSPIRYMRRLTGYDEDNPLMIATRELQKGEIASLDYRRRALEPFLKFTDMKFTSYLNGNKAPEIEVNATTIDMKPTTVKITPAIRIWFYLSSMNADNMRHIVNGGVRIPDVKLLKKGKRTDAYDNGTLVRFSKSQVQAIIDGMTSKEEAYAKAVFNYFNKVAPEATNAVSETLDGISIAKVKNYVPIHVDDTFLDVEGDTIKMDGTVEGMGSHKERVQSSKPAYAEDVSDLLMRSIDADMKYVGMAIPLRNFGKIYRSSSMESARGQAEHIELTGETNNSPSTLVYGDEQTATYRTRTGGYVSVRDAIRSLWTSDATKYIDKFLSDLQFPHSQVGEVERTLRELTSNYAGAVLTLNASVAIKQSASYPTAGAVLGWKPLIKAFTKVGKLDLDYANSVTPLLAYRAEGFNFREAGDIQNRDGRDSWFKRIMRTPLFNWIQGMDLLTTRKLFKASEIYVQDKYHLKRGQSGYDEKVAEIFNKVITETQPNYTVMERAGHLRSDSTLERTLSMFKTQPYQNFNIWYDATGDYLDKRDAYKKAKTKANREALKEASVNLGNATTSQIAQLAVFAMMTSLWALARGKDDKWRDEEGNLSFASYLKQLAHDMIGGVASEFFLGSDVFSALDSVINDSYYSGFSSVTDSSINDFFNTGMDMTKLLQQAWDYAVKGNEEEIDTDKLLKQMEKVVTEGGRFSGIPTGNLINLKNLMYRWVCVSKDGEYIGEYEALKASFAKDSYKKDILKRAYRNDKKAYEELRQMMIDDGMKESTLDKYINDSARENPTEEQTNSYKRSLDFLEGNRLWYNNDSVYIEDYDNALRDIALGISTDDTERLKKLESVGISPEENVLIRLAMEKADILYGDKNGTLNKDEKLQALEMVRSSLTLTDKEKEEILKTSFSFGKGKKKS